MTVSDDMDPGSSVIQVSASDLDSEHNGYVTHWLSASDGKFQIEANSGWVTLKSALNQSDNREHAMTVFARDHGIPARTAQTQLQVIVDNSNRHAPVFSRFSYDVVVPENLNPGATIEQFTATDQDQDPTGQVRYEITEGDEDVFEIDPYRGAVSLKKVLDFEQKPFYEMKVTALDSGTPIKSTAVTLHVTVTDVNDNGPIFQPFPRELRVAKALPANELVCTFHATDADSPVNDNNRVRYQLIRGTDR